MKYLVYAALAFIAGLLFLPKSGTTEIRNLPLLIVVLVILLILVLRRLFLYAVLMIKTKNLLKAKKATIRNIKFFPWSSWFHGHYSMVFRHQGQTVQLLFLARKRKYRRYHFGSINCLEFYRANRVVFNSTKASGAIISKRVEVKQVGRQRICWEASATLRAIVFDRLPNEITDSVKRGYLAVGDKIGNAEVLLLDFPSLCEKIKENI